MNKHDIVVITGGSRRLGRAMALSLASKGHDIALHYHQSDSEARRLQHQLLELPVRCGLFKADLIDADACRALIARVADELGAPGILINNASLFPHRGRPREFTAQWDPVFRINLLAPMLLAETFAGRVGEGVIVNILDTRIAADESLRCAYTLSKKALENFTRMAAVQLAPAIRVAGIAPGLLLPPAGCDGEYLRKRASGTPLQKAPTMEQFLQTLEFILTNESITGQVIYVNSGEHLQRIQAPQEPTESANPITS